ncbi:5'-AMP-activated protein Kinase subunit gamma, partial [Phytophthora palmivora]
MSHDGYYASSRDDAPPPAPHSSTSGFNDPANPTTMHSMADSNGLLQRTHVVMPPQLQGDEDQSMSDANSASGLNLTQSSVMDIVKEGKRVIAAFLGETKCYDVIKNSGKVVVFDVKIPINLAFFALVEHDIKSVPIWDAEQGKFVGMFTATDFVNILRHFYIRGSPMNELAEHSIASWR